MLLLSSLLLFLSALVGGLAVLAKPKLHQGPFQYGLIFSGGYLFSLTVLHLLPTLFTLPVAAQHIGLYLLVGFFLQQLLELLSKGVEHGHVDFTPGHVPSIRPLTLLLSLCCHALLDGAILGCPTAPALHQHTHTLGGAGLLLGILLHKVPVAFAFTSILHQLVGAQRTVLVYLLVFALASPVGLWGSHYCGLLLGGAAQGSAVLGAIVSGSFLHIATTIFFEARPGHQLHARQFLASLAGAGLAVLAEFLL